MLESSVEAWEDRPLAPSPDETSVEELLQVRVGWGNEVSSSVEADMTVQLESVFCVLALIDDVRSI